MVAHWGSPDPADAAGTEEERYRLFVNVASQIARRVELFCSFPDEKLRDLATLRGVGERFRIGEEEA